MRRGTFIFTASDGLSIFVYRWLPDIAPRAVVQIFHGLAEHAGRYARLAEALTGIGCVVYAADNRGHGRTARTPEELGFLGRANGWRACLDDLWRLNRRIAVEYPGLPIVLIGHSMGAFMTQQFIADYDYGFAGALLSGLSGRLPRLAMLAPILARIERVRLGARGRSRLINDLTFGTFNKSFEPARTPFDWLSRDCAEVDKFIADPLCGVPFSVQLSIDVLAALANVASPSRLARIPKQLPIHIIAGTRDPVSAGTKALQRLLAVYRAAGLERVTYRFYPEARHALFNETNRDEVTSDVLAWLRDVLGLWTASHRDRAPTAADRPWA